MGFTLVEVIVVLVIIAILAAALVPSMIGWIDKALEKEMISKCRACVTAAQTLISEKYGLSGSMAAPDSDEVVKLADVGGKVEGITADPVMAYINTLTYNENGYSVTYERLPSPHYVFNTGSSLPPAVEWVESTEYKVGDTVLINGKYFTCIREHTSGVTSATRNPDEKANKNTWRIIGFADGADNGYSYIYNYAEGVVVKYNGILYRRNNYTPTSCDTPSSSSKYWDIVE